MTTGTPHSPDPIDPAAAPRGTDNASHRLTRLEEKLCFSDDLLDHLNRQVAAQQEQIDLLMREVARLRQQLASRADEGEGVRSLRDELPPHY